MATRMTYVVWGQQTFADPMTYQGEYAVLTQALLKFCTMLDAGYYAVRIN